MVSHKCDVKWTGKYASWNSEMKIREYYCKNHDSLFYSSPANPNKYCWKISVLRRKQHKSLRR